MSNMSKLLKRQLLALILLPLLCGGASFLFTRMAIVPQYGSTATAVVRGSGSKDGVLSYEDMLAAQALARMAVTVAQSRDIAEAVSDEIDDPAITADYLLKSVTVAVIPESNIVSIEYFDSDPYRSALVANQYIAALVARVPIYYEGTALVSLDYAVVAQLPSRPNVVFNTLAAVLAGLAAAMVLVYVMANYIDHDQ